MSKKNVSQMELALEKLETACNGATDNLVESVGQVNFLTASVAWHALNIVATRNEASRLNTLFADISNRIKGNWHDTVKGELEKIVEIFSAPLSICGQYDENTQAIRYGYTLPDGSTVFDRKNIKKNVVTVDGFKLIDRAAFLEQWAPYLNNLDGFLDDYNTTMEHACKVVYVAPKAPKATEKTTEQSLTALAKLYYATVDLDIKAGIADIFRTKNLPIPAPKK